MPLRALLKYLANNEQLVQKLAESYPVRRAAQMAIAIFYRGKAKAAKMDPEQINQIMSIYRKFAQNLREGIQDAKKQLKK